MKKKPPTVPLHLRIDADLLEHLKREARRLAVERDECVSSADLIRETLGRMFPREERCTGPESRSF